MEQAFRDWLVQRGNAGAAKSYPKAINLISAHYSKETGQKTDVYAIPDQVLISQIAHDYSQSGKFSKYGYEQHGLYRAAIARYSEFFVQHGQSEKSQPTQEDIELSIPIDTNFAYERDLQRSVCAQISELFPGYGIFGGNSVGIEYQIDGKRIDILLEKKDGGDLLVVELKSGTADYKVFGQISMYIGLLLAQFPSRIISGVIVAGAIDPSLKHACTTMDRVSLKVYRMSVELDDYETLASNVNGQSQ